GVGGYFNGGTMGFARGAPWLTVITIFGKGQALTLQAFIGIRPKAFFTPPPRSQKLTLNTFPVTFFKINPSKIVP
ncbi:MAG: hypothetical protein ACPL6D_10740, partial [Thermodesulfobacteriota bacterium]